MNIARIVVLAASVCAAVAQQQNELGGTALAGPAVLTRGGRTAVGRNAAAASIRPYFFAEGVFDNALTAVTLSRDGTVPFTSAYGVEAGAGVYGAKRWKRTELAIDYEGMYRHYSQKTFFNGTDQLFSLRIEHQINRRVTVQFRESAGTFTRNFWSFGSTSLVDSTFSNAPLAEIYDNRTNYLNSLFDITYQKSARLSFNFGGDAFVIRRRSAALAGSTGGRARGDFAYRYSRRSSIGAGYNFSHFEFTRVFGSGNVHGVAVSHSTLLDKNTELAFQVGGNQVETQYLERVRLDPAVAAIIGESGGVLAQYRKNYLPYAAVRLTYAFPNGSASINYNRGISPGNGLLLLSQQESVLGNINYGGARRASASLHGGWLRMKGLAQAVSPYDGYMAGAGVTYKLTRMVHAIAQVDWRHFSVGQFGFSRDQYRASFGIAFSPGERPLAFR